MGKRHELHTSHGYSSNSPNVRNGKMVPVKKSAGLAQNCSGSDGNGSSPLKTRIPVDTSRSVNGCLPTLELQVTRGFLSYRKKKESWSIRFALEMRITMMKVQALYVRQKLAK